MSRHRKTRREAEIQANVLMATIERELFGPRDSHLGKRIGGLREKMEQTGRKIDDLAERVEKLEDGKPGVTPSRWRSQTFHDAPLRLQ